MGGDQGEDLGGVLGNEAGAYSFDREEGLLAGRLGGGDRFEGRVVGDGVGRFAVGGAQAPLLELLEQGGVFGR